jgi:hypothetical protein
VSRRADHRLSQESLDALQGLVGRRARFAMPSGLVWLGADGVVVGANGIVIEHWDAGLRYRPAAHEVRLAYLSARQSQIDAQRGPGQIIAYPRAPIGLRAARYHVDRRGELASTSLTRLFPGPGVRLITAIHVHAAEVEYEEWDAAKGAGRPARARQDRRLVFALEPEGAVAFEPFDGVQAARLMAMNGAVRPADRAGEELRLRLTLH